MSRSTNTTKRSAVGRGLFLSRDSGGQHEMTPGQYVQWAKNQASQLGVSFRGTAADIEQLIRSNHPQQNDVFFDYCVTGNLLNRPALDALKDEIRRDPTVSHIFIPRRDRLARPDHAVDGVMLERELRELGVTLVFMDITLAPLRRGQRQDVGEAIAAYVAYENSGKFRDELAEKMIYAQLELAKRGFSTGGRPPFGFRRNLIRDDGTVIRELMEGEIVRQKGHHVVWLPGPERELDLIRRILSLLKTLPATRVARLFNEEKIPAPDFGRRRTDGGVRHIVSGQWHATTITNIARNPLLRAVVSYGRRSMGDCRRVTPEGPRPVDDNDFQNNKPKVIQNPDSQRINGKAHCEPLVPLEQLDELTAMLDRRAGTQRGKPRSRDPNKNPLGGRVYDMACGWPMYRTSYSGSFQYICGFYQQTHGGSCNHNHIPGPVATKFALAAIRQLLQNSPSRDRLAQRLRQKLPMRATDHGIQPDLVKLRTELEELSAQVHTATRNLALAETEDIFRSIEGVLGELQERQSKMSAELTRQQRKQESPIGTNDLIERALQTLSRLPQLAEDSENLAAIGELFQRMNLQMFLQFQPTQRGRRVVNRLAGGMLTTGEVSSPITKYAGPTGRRGLQQTLQADRRQLEAGRTASGSQTLSNSGEAENSLGNVNRDDRI